MGNEQVYNESVLLEQEYAYQYQPQYQQQQLAQAQFQQLPAYVIIAAARLFVRLTAPGLLQIQCGGLQSTLSSMSLRCDRSNALADGHWCGERSLRRHSVPAERRRHAVPRRGGMESLLL